MSPTERIVDCEQALRRLAEYLDNELGQDHAGEIERHLHACRSCFSRAEFERALKTRLGQLREEPVPQNFERRIDELARSFISR